MVGRPVALSLILLIQSFLLLLGLVKLAAAALSCSMEVINIHGLHVNWLTMKNIVVHYVKMTVMGLDTEIYTAL